MVQKNFERRRWTKKANFKGEKYKSFKNFHKVSKLQKAAFTAIAVQASPDDIKELKELF